MKTDTMKTEEVWIKEQRVKYKAEVLKTLKAKMEMDLREAITFLRTDDLDTVNRFVGGVWSILNDIKKDGLNKKEKNKGI